MKSASNKPSHTTKGDVFDDLGLSRSEATAMKFKAIVFDAILDEIRIQRYTQKELVKLLDEYQPSVSNLMHGKIAQVSVEKLLAYADRMGIRTSLTVRGSASRGVRRSRAKAA